MSTVSVALPVRLADAFAPHAARGLLPARVAVEHRSQYVLYAEWGELTAVLAGKLRHEARTPAELPAVGDWVAVSPPDGEGAAVIRAVLPRAGVFSRKAVETEADEQVVAANVDVVFLVDSLGGGPNVRRLERYLTVAWEGGAEPVVVLTKADLADAGADADEAMRSVERVAAGVPVHRVSSLTGEGVDALRGYPAGGRTVALLGPSGVGKSTLINALLGSERQRTGAVRDDGKGRHTTTHRELVPVPGGGFLLDTPGMRELALWGDERALAGAFDDVAALAAHCRFADCAHAGEPDCAVAAAAADGRLDPERLASFHKLRAELRHLAAKADPLLREATQRHERVMDRALQTRLREKYH